jgi:hypothetical protein
VCLLRHLSCQEAAVPVAVVHLFQTQVVGVAAGEHSH